MSEQPINECSGPPEGWVQDGEGRWFDPRPHAEAVAGTASGSAGVPR